MKLKYRKSLARRIRPSDAPDISSQPYHPSSHYSRYFFHPRMAQTFTAEQVEEFRDAERDNLRVKKLGWAFTGVPMSNAQEDYCRLGQEEKDALRAAAACRNRSFSQVSFKFSSAY